MKAVKSITSLSYVAIACNAALLSVLFYTTNFSEKHDLIALSLAGFGLIISILYAVQLILMERSYYRHDVITVSAKVFLHICRIINLLYSLLGTFSLIMTFYSSAKFPGYIRLWENKFWALLGLVLVTVVMDFTIFFRGWRLLKLVKRPYIEEVMASFD